jgi:hypothetical protein
MWKPEARSKSFSLEPPFQPNRPFLDDQNPPAGHVQEERKSNRDRYEHAEDDDAHPQKPNQLQPITQEFHFPPSYLRVRRSFISSE